MRIRVCFPDDSQRTEYGDLVTVRAAGFSTPAGAEEFANV
jgi:hypothetical protein